MNEGPAIVRPSWVRFVVVIVGMALLGLMVAVSAATVIARVNANELRARCERSVVGREDNRAMWLWLADYVQRPDNQPEIEDLLNELDRRLPSLRCVDGIPLPLEED